MAHIGLDRGNANNDIDGNHGTSHITDPLNDDEKVRELLLDHPDESAFFCLLRMNEGSLCLRSHGIQTHTHTCLDAGPHIWPLV